MLNIIGNLTLQHVDDGQAWQRLETVAGLLEARYLASKALQFTHSVSTDVRVFVDVL